MWLADHPSLTAALRKRSVRLPLVLALAVSQFVWAACIWKFFALGNNWL